jgi:hypothetical protein
MKIKQQSNDSFTDERSKEVSETISKRIEMRKFAPEFMGNAFKINTKNEVLPRNGEMSIQNKLKVNKNAANSFLLTSKDAIAH